MKEEIRKRELEDDMRKFLDDLERLSGNSDKSTGPKCGTLIEDTKGLGVEEGMDVVGVCGDIDLLELSARGISILQGIVCINGEQELGGEVNRLSLKTSDGRIQDPDTPAGLWSKVRNIFTHIFS